MWRTRLSAGIECRIYSPIDGFSGVAERKSFLIRIDPAVWEGVSRWAADDLRSVNAQVEFLLREALKRTGRLTEKKIAAKAPPKSDRD